MCVKTCIKKVIYYSNYNQKWLDISDTKHSKIHIMDNVTNTDNNKSNRFTATIQANLC